MLRLAGKYRARKRIAVRLYAAAVAAARAPVFFTKLRVPDTLDGRFDLLALHGWLLLDALRSAGRGELEQAVTDLIFTGFDEGLRELGAGDMTIARRIKQMADAFYGRLAAYHACANETDFTAALIRNVYRGSASEADAAKTVARYVMAARLRLSRSDLVAGNADFGPPPEGKQ
ncbi:MAG TPA: ubiquinol-cytochrome C chaperone family protein [Rhizomicrobium sp.]|jgi:cytochrome b pre-mRNA-processing protein 3|nr:ubiquinol-cytochrome C chaperone family protein [Rhizomicrobium sp.]